MSINLAIGIDLGTTYCCVAAVKDGKTVVIPNKMGNYLTPSYISFTDKERIIGRVAKNQAARNPQNTIYDIKRLIGREFSDAEIQNEVRIKPFEIVKYDGRLKINIKRESSVESYLPEELSAMLLTELKENAEMHFNEKITAAVITVPASFNNFQRQCTFDAGKFAGLNVLQLLNEPTAVALAYELDSSSKDGANVLIYDLGGGTFDVSIIQISDGKVTVLNTAGDAYLGGQDFDMRLVEYCLGEFSKQTGKNARVCRRAMNSLLGECEKAKKYLSSTSRITIQIDSFYDGEDLQIEITRRLFEELCGDLFNRTIGIVQKSLDAIKLEADSIDEIVLAGGSTRIPRIHEILKSFFEGKVIKITIDADRAIAEGAAILANKIMNNDELNELVLLEKTSNSLGVGTAGGKMEVLIARNSTIPCITKKRFTTNKDYKNEVPISIFEGEHEFSESNHRLGEFTLIGISSVLKYVPQIDVTFEINESGILIVSASELKNDVEAKLAVNFEKMDLCGSENVKSTTSTEQLVKSEITCTALSASDSVSAMGSFKKPTEHL